MQIEASHCREAGLKSNSACKVSRGKSCNNSKRRTATEPHGSETPTTTDACEEDGGQTTVEPDNDYLTTDDEEIIEDDVDYDFNDFDLQ
ncbi:unnamed protein product [Acanthoscelides obtectus]|nr:unnamed protein product [Acanthoscelides obtectus]CAK1624258.1 hypothetical protein AOBTE_LOCUS2447 [Acanthoscelides obtectus]